MAITIIKKTLTQIGRYKLMVVTANFNTTDTSGTIPLGIKSNVYGFYANWIPSSTALADYPPQMAGALVAGAGHVQADANNNITVVRNGTTSGSIFQALILFR